MARVPYIGYQNEDTMQNDKQVYAVDWITGSTEDFSSTP